MVILIISGGQTGVDRSALEAAIESGLQAQDAWCGYCPAGRRAEDGKVPEIYNMTETVSSDYRNRTEKNIVSADATLIFKSGSVSSGTAYTIRTARTIGKPLYIVDVSDVDLSRLKDWLSQYDMVNIAGPRESMRPGIAMQTKQILLTALEDLLEDNKNNNGSVPADREVL